MATALALSLIGRGDRYDQVRALTYGVVLTSMLLQGATICPVARILLREVKLRINRTQGLVLAFSVVAWVSLIVIMVVAPEILVGALRLLPGHQRGVETAFLLAISAVLAVLGVGVIRRWRWTFWVVLMAFLAGLLRVPASALELVGVLPTNEPTWYLLLQAGIGLVQFAIGLAMISGLRRAGIWGAFGRRVVRG